MYESISCFRLRLLLDGSCCAQAIDRGESRNHRLYYDCAQITARLANRNKSCVSHRHRLVTALMWFGVSFRRVLQLSLSMLDRALKADPGNPLYLTEHAYQLTLLGTLLSAALARS